MSVVDISVLGVTSEKEEQVLLELTPEDYTKRVNEEIDKYYSTDLPRTSIDLKNLTFAETTDMLDLSNTYAYLSPGTISNGSAGINLLNKGESLWNSSQYQDLYTKSLSPITPSISSGPESALSSLSSLGISITTAPNLMPVGPDTNLGPYVNPKNVLGENTKFPNQDLFRFEVLKTLSPVELAQADIALKSVVDLLGQSESTNIATEEYSVATVSISQFDLSVSTNTIDQNLRNPGPANNRTLFGMPPQLKSLFLGRSKSIRKNWLDSPSDPLTNVETSGMMQFIYFEVQEVQALIGYGGDIKSPTYTKLTEQMVENIKENGGTLFCRTVRYQNTNIIPGIKRKLNYRTNDQYFVISKEVSPQNTKPPSSLTQFGQALMKQLAID